ncbi:MAG TPA: hypothetical protein VI168_19205 [Croceibacterium sp.]
MQLSPGILGAGAAVLVAGIAAGDALGTVPPMQPRGVAELLPQARTVAFAGRFEGDLPDHYPLITRSGRYEVHELGERGLYSQARFGYRQRYLAAHYPTEAESAPALETAPADVAGLAPEPDDPAPLAPAGPAVAKVTPRMIDVAAELALVPAG